VIDIFNQIADAEINGNKKLKAELKQNNLYYFTPCVRVDSFRRYANIRTFTGLMVLDFDHIDNAQELKEHVFNEYKFIVAAWLSPSRKGLKAFVSIPICTNTDEFKDRFKALSNEFDCFDGFDGSPKNCVLPLFQSYDYDTLYREEFETFDGIQLDEKDFSVTPDYNFNFDASNSKHKDRIIKIIDTGFFNISDNGHPQLRALCVSIGGYIANGYIDKFEALQYINYKIQHHNYLKKGIRGYQKTANQMLDYGTQKPLEL
jgi:hypothetical protein